MVSSAPSSTFEILDEELQFIPLLYGFESGEREVWVASCGLTSRPVHLFIPSLNIVIYELNHDRAKRRKGGNLHASTREDGPHPKVRLTLESEQN